MSQTEDSLKQKADELALASGDPERIELIHQVRRFKRSWLEMAQALVAVRRRRLYEKWGYRDLYDYCNKELMLKAATVDKLTGSFVALEHHAPRVLKQRDSDDRELPSLDAVDYFARAVRGKSANDEWDGEADPSRSDDEVRELRAAVFDEQRPVSLIRREFNERFFPRDEKEDDSTKVERARSLARKLQELVPSLRGLSRSRAKELVEVLEAFQQELDVLKQAS